MVNLIKISSGFNILSRCRERNIEDTKLITNLQEDKLKMTMEISKLEKEVTKLLSEKEGKETEILQMKRNYNNAIQQYKIQVMIIFVSFLLWIKLKEKLFGMTLKILRFCYPWNLPSNSLI